ncbi:MAG TPA: hypothetical protein IGS52_05595 [Oscillatoriaceae cyanobacterium M33_DOE_052]|uniref:Uncharacterized protein n=1 Tax=Planktothricoides sp. SpSt-374 TaxID=2282167 RepID=A0A7C3ZJ72_9CYAN|nr:hypothetical protein [Oscillatoriaceae cyanobacterium M33_DOE_052]
MSRKLLPSVKVSGAEAFPVPSPPNLTDQGGSRHYRHILSEPGHCRETGIAAVPEALCPWGRP